VRHPVRDPVDLGERQVIATSNHRRAGPVALGTASNNFYRQHCSASSSAASACATFRRCAQARAMSISGQCCSR
jgi:hypothetical protein